VLLQLKTRKKQNTPLKSHKILTDKNITFTKQETQGIAKISYDTDAEQQDTYDFNKAELENTEVKDAYDYAYVVGDDKKLSLELEIDYTDAKGTETTRQIKLKRFRFSQDKKEGLLYGYCYLRGGGRDFSVSRIQRCVNVETGEIIVDIIKYLEEQYEFSSGGQLEKMWNDFTDEMNVLVYVGKLDGMLRKKEKEIIASYALSRNETFRLSIEEIIEDMTNITSLSKTQFARALGRLSTKMEQERKDLIDYAERILNTKKNKKPEEEDVIPYMLKRLLPKDK
jgi:hypothetical protein